MGSPPRVGRMRRFSVLLAWLGSLSAQTPPSASVPFLAGESDVAIVVDANAVRASGLFAASETSPIGTWLAGVAKGTGLAIEALDRIALVRRARADASAHGDTVLVLVGGAALQLPAATDALPTCEVAGRDARALDGATTAAFVLVQLEAGVLVAGRRDLVASQLEALASNEAAIAAATATWSLRPGELVRARFPFRGDGLPALVSRPSSRRVAVAAAPGELSLRWVRSVGEPFAIAFVAGPFRSDFDALHGWMDLEQARAGLASRDYAKPILALLARAKPVRREREVAIEVTLGEAREAFAAVDVMLRFAGLPLPPAR